MNNRHNTVVRLIWILSIPSVAALMLFPIVTNLVRLGIIAGLSLIWAGGILLHWRNRWIRGVFFVILAIVILLTSLPGRQADPQRLRESFVSELLGYEGVKYVWGGENRLGIDCSGLIREAYVKANFKLGLTTLNPKLVRNAAVVWCRDCGANTMGNGYNGRTKLLRTADNLEKLVAAGFEPGDIIVAKTGFHTFAYMGNDQFIEASPAKGRVVKVSTKDKSEEWKKVPVKLISWSDM